MASTPSEAETENNNDGVEASCDGGDTYPNADTSDTETDTTDANSEIDRAQGHVVSENEESNSDTLESNSEFESCAIATAAETVESTTSSSSGISAEHDDDDEDDDDDISQSTPIARPNLSENRHKHPHGAAAPGNMPEPPQTKSGKPGSGAIPVVVASSASRGAVVPPVRFITEEIQDAMDDTADVDEPPLQLQHVQHSVDGDDDDGVSAVTNSDQRTASTGSTGGSSGFLDAHFPTNRPVTPPRLPGWRPSAISQAAADGIAGPFTFTIPGAYPVFPDRTRQASDALERGLSDYTLPTRNTSTFAERSAIPVEEDGTDRATVDSGEMIELATCSVYRLAEAAVVDDDVVVDARPVNEEADSDLMEQMAEMGRQNSLALVEAKEKGRRQRGIAWSALIVAAAAVAIVVTIVTKNGRANRDKDSGGSTNSTTPPDDDPHVLPPIIPSVTLSLAEIVGGASSGGESVEPFDSNRLDALDWMSKDRISLSLLQAAGNNGGDKISEGEQVRKLRQRYAAALFFLTTNGPLWYARLGFLSGKDECDWNRVILGNASDGEVTTFGGAAEVKGIICDEEGRIQRINVWWNGISGTLPSELSFLSDSLEELNLVGGSLSGTIPSSFGDLTNLERLYLSENCLTGMLPESLSNLQQLKHVNLHGNDDLSGSLNELCETNAVDWFVADCGNCPGSEIRIQCDCCHTCCESSSFSCCDKEGERLWQWMNLAKNPITKLPHSFGRECLSEESLKWREEECPCVVYGDDGGICSTNAADCDV